ncbi:hypothetical protein HDV00_006857 [Rhizophlyctis rosea]|nr:hypothetical protein HDV00_006857 [Rhizophlyctis rosea]
MVLQYMCQDTSPGLRDGTTRNTIPEDPTNAAFMTYGQHETYDFYQKCKTRQRNRKLYLADRNLNGDSAIYTRQNNNGERFGFECPEERDYYPYWHPSPWRDIYVCTDEPSRCSYYRRESQNVQDKGSCSDPQYNSRTDCEANLNIWSASGNYGTDPPDCGVCPTTKNNHLGQSMDTGATPKYTWTIPEGVVPDGSKCVLRLRYNISTTDYDGWGTDALYNGANSKVKGNPTVDFLGLGGNVSGPLTLNVNTAQFGRTFEDRSHVFIIRKKPDVKRNFIKTTRIINLNIKGRRGNIVQVYPAVEYNFVPDKIEARRGDYLHIQWTGSDANQRGNAGNGRDGTDRNNLVLMSGLGVNYPLNFNPDGKDPPTHFTNDRQMIAYLAFLNQTNCTTTADANNRWNCARLNAASGYIDAGLVRIENTGTFYFASVRNNAFSNREQKATLVVGEDLQMIGAAVGVTAITTAAVAGIGVGMAAFIRVGRANPTSRYGAMVRLLRLQGEPASPDLSEPEVVQRPNWLLARLQKWWTWEGQKFAVVAIYSLINLAVWIYGYADAAGKNPAPYYPYAKGFGKTLNINCSFIILPILRNILCWLRSTPLADIIPLDDNIRMHKLVFIYIMIGGLAHATLHYLDFRWDAEKYGGTIGDFAWNNLAGATGHLIAFCMTLMAGTSLLNRKLITVFGKRFDGYRTFLMFHKLWIPCFALLWLHGPNFWAFSIWPLALMALEKLVQTTRAKVDVTIVEAKIVGKDVLSLKLQLQGKRKFTYRAGEYLYLNCPDIASEEWHPFTITTAPEEGHFGVHIRCRPEMDWCFALRTRLGLAPKPKVVHQSPRVSVVNVAKSSKMEGLEEGVVEAPSGTEAASTSSIPRLRVDGPYGSPSEDVFDHSTVMLVGAGIGVTPFISILKSISLRSKQKLALGGPATQDKFKVYFYWICRDEAEFQSFKDLIDAVIESADLKDMLQVNTYTTGELDLKKVKYESYNQFSGKPNWNRILQEIAQTHNGEEVGVFMCGPLPLARELSQACKKQNIALREGKGGKRAMGQEEERTAFRFHKENF